jgi:hypothetical protein
MFQRQYPDDSYFYVEIARRIDFHIPKVCASIPPELYQRIQEAKPRVQIATKADLLSCYKAMEHGKSLPETPNTKRDLQAGGF